MFYLPRCLLISEPGWRFSQPDSLIRIAARCLQRLTGLTARRECDGHVRFYDV